MSTITRQPGLATIANAGADPGSFYGRAGRSPGAAHDAAIRTEQTSHALLTAIKAAHGEALLTGYQRPAEHLRLAVRTLTGCLTTEAGIAAASLTADLSVPEPDAASAARKDLQFAAFKAGTAGGGVFGAWRILRRCASELADDSTVADEPLGKSAAATATAAGELDELLRRDGGRAIPAALPMIAGHAHITQHLALALHGLSSSCIALSEAVRGSAPRAQRAGTTITGPLYYAGEALRDAGNSAMKAHDVLEAAAAIIRSAPAGIPCGSCSGTTKSRLTGAACERCRGGGTDPYAGRQ